MALKKWDYFNEAELFAPCLFDAWWKTLYSSVWDEISHEDLKTIWPNFNHTVYLMKNDSIGSERYFDVVNTPETETLGDLARISFGLALEQMDEWKNENDLKLTWSNYRNSEINHLLKLEPFSFDHIEIGGGTDIVNAVSSKAGPSWRMVVELNESGVRGWGVYPGSQTGNPGNPKYGHMIENWAKGDYFPLLFLKSKDEENPKIIFSQTLSNN